MFICTRNGKRVEVEDEKFGDDDCLRFAQSVGLFSDTTVLKPVWIVHVQKVKCWDSMQNAFSRDEKYEFVAEQKYDHEPSKEELMYLLSYWGCTRNDIVTIDKGYELDEEYDD